LAGLVAIIILAGQKSGTASAWVKLPDGNSVRVLGVSYGTNHVFGSKFAKTASRLPLWARDILGTIFGPRKLVLPTSTTTPKPALLLWIDCLTNNAAVPSGGYYEVFLAESNFTSGEGEFFHQPVPFAPQVQPIDFPIFPRREREITMDFFYHDANDHIQLCHQFSFPNPLFKKYPVWPAESLPATKRVGDIEVTLLSVETGHDNSSSMKALDDGSTLITYGTNRVDGRNYTAVNLRIKPLGNTNEVWRVDSLDISDATGNVAHSMSMGWNGSDAQFEFMPGLWPGETWKLKLFLKRTAGFRANELFSFKNVPLGEMNRTNILQWSSNFAGIPVTLESVCRRAPHTNNSWISSQLSSAKFTHSAIPAGIMELVEAVFGGAKTNQSASSEWSDYYHQYEFREIPADAKTADFTFAIQQLRTVEFTVMPDLPKPIATAKK